MKLSFRITGQLTNLVRRILFAGTSAIVQSALLVVALIARGHSYRNKWRQLIRGRRLDERVQDPEQQTRTASTTTIVAMHGQRTRSTRTKSETNIAVWTDSSSMKSYCVLMINIAARE